MASSKEGKNVDFYKILGINSDATSSEVRKAYQKKLTYYHPDKNKDLSKDECSNILNRITDAYSVLSNPKRREYYDRNYLGKNNNSDDFQSLKDSFKEFIDNEEWVPAEKRQFQNSKQLINDFYDNNKDLLEHNTDVYADRENSNRLVDDLKQQREMQDNELIPSNPFPDVDFNNISEEERKNYMNKFNQMFNKKMKKQRNKKDEMIKYGGNRVMPDNIQGGDDVIDLETGDTIGGINNPFQNDDEISQLSSDDNNDNLSDYDLDNEEDNPYYGTNDDIQKRMEEMMNERKKHTNPFDFDELPEEEIEKYQDLFNPDTKRKKDEINEINEKFGGKSMTLEDIKGIEEIQNKYAEEAEEEEQSNEETKKETEENNQQVRKPIDNYQDI
jgi:curved DNA-binding protein CbpA